MLLKWNVPALVTLPFVQQRSGVNVLAVCAWYLLELAQWLHLPLAAASFQGYSVCSTYIFTAAKRGRGGGRGGHGGRALVDHHQDLDA